MGATGGVKRSALAAGLISVLTSACALYGPNRTSVLVTECVRPADQFNTFAGRWRALPVPIAFKGGHFDSTEVSDVLSAADSWNDFYGASLGIKALDYGAPEAPNLSSAALPNQSTLCGQGIIQGSSYSGQVVVFKRGKWPYTNLPNAIALTSFCPVPAKPFSSFYMAVIEINYANYFVAGRKIPDLQSIILHEFGHLLGLNHSCEGRSTKSGVPD